MNKITIKNVQAKGTRLVVDFSCHGSVRKFINQKNFVVEYDRPIETVPESLLIIPFLATVAPIAYAAEAEVQISAVDAEFVDSLAEIRETLQRFYPKMSFNGEGGLRPEKVVSLPVKPTGKRMALFSGGLDSLVTFIRHEAEKPILVNIKNVDLNKKTKKTDPSVNSTSKSISEFYKIVQTDKRLILSNWMFIPSHYMLRAFFTELGGCWWRQVMHSLSFIGLCAPLAYLEGVDTLYIASSFTAEFTNPWGSHPEIDNKVRWSGTHVIHDAYELSRQNKMKILAKYINTEYSELQICVCSLSAKENCNQCEKCSRTIMGLELAGVDPTKHGFIVTSKTFPYIRRMLETHSWRFGDDEVFMWTDLQKNVKSAKLFHHPEAKELADWLQTIDIESLRVTSIKGRRGEPIIRNLPYPLFKIAEKCYKIVKNIYPKHV